MQTMPMWIVFAGCGVEAGGGGGGGEWCWEDITKLDQGEG